MPTLQQRLAEQPPATSGIHEAMAQHTEDIFDEFHGILPLFLGKRRLGPFVTLTLPNETVRSREALLATISDLIVAYDFRLISFVSAIRTHLDADQKPKLGAILITTDNAKALFQLPWELEFDSENDLVSYSRSDTEDEIISSDTWLSYFQNSKEPESRQMAHDRLLNTFNDPSLLPKFSLDH